MLRSDDRATSSFKAEWFQISDRMDSSHLRYEMLNPAITTLRNPT
jgi:hypothetical protein